MAKASFTPVGNSADSPALFLRLSPATGHAAEILDVSDPYVGYDAETIAVHLSVFEPVGGVLGNSSPPSFLSFVTEPMSSGWPEKP